EPRVMMIALDAVPPELLHQWCDDGTLPNLRQLREESTAGTTESVADLLPGAVWPTLITGTDPSFHGIEAFMQWEPKTQSFRRPSREWLEIEPFWKALARRQVPGVVMDVAFAQPHADYGPVVEVQGWGMHDELVPAFSQPAGLLKEIHKNYGKSGLRPDVPGPRSKAVMTRDLRLLVGMVPQRTSIVAELAGRFPWRFLFAVYSESHRAGHWFWTERYSGKAHAGLKRVVVEFDRELPRLRAFLQPRDVLVVFSAHGFGTNHDIDRFSDGVGEALEPETTGRPAQRFDPVRLVNQLLPQGLRHSVAAVFPTTVRDRLFAHSLSAGRDWANTKTLVTVPDGHLYFRANVKGREKEGCLEPSELDAHLAALTDEIMAIRNERGEEVFEGVVRLSDRYQGPRLDLLPDLVASIHQRPIGDVLTLRDGREVRVPARGFRDGDHRPTGFYLMAGPDIAKAATGEALSGEVAVSRFLGTVGL
ncbi:MAG: alkaline phosphatase family protein, partial [Dehalococcoidia bacterium]